VAATCKAAVRQHQTNGKRLMKLGQGTLAQGKSSQDHANQTVEQEQDQKEGTGNVADAAAAENTRV
jgi:hypothetical protein